MKGFFLAALAVSALISFVAAWVLPLTTQLHKALHMHLALAMGAMPLIMGAISHFVPVLARSRPPGERLKLAPLAALGGGGLAVAHFGYGAAVPAFAVAGAILGLAAAVGLGAWVTACGRAALGKPHPCLYWYLAALGCLALGLAAVLAMEAWPAQRLAFKRFHLHVNTLGFIGLAAVGTLQVLLPTAVARPDAQAAIRLRRDLGYALAGTLAIAVGAAWWSPLAWLGLALWAIPAFRLALAWLGGYRREMFAVRGAAPLLGSALAGFAAALVAGGLHAAGAVAATGGAHLYIFAFLFPLVSGASGQLLPLWLRPGPQTPWHARTRKRLTSASGLRAVLFLGAGVLVASGTKWGMWLALAGLALFMPLAVWALLRDSEET